MPAIELDDGKILSWTVSLGDVGPLTAYQDWATALGAPTTGTDQNLDGDDSAFGITAGASVWPGGTARVFYASESGLGIYTSAPSNEASAAYDLTAHNIARFYGFTSRPKLLLAYHSARDPSDLQSVRTQMRTVGNTTIIYAEHRTYNSSLSDYAQASQVYQVALRLQPGRIDFIGYSYRVGHYVQLFELQQGATSEIIARKTQIAQHDEGIFQRNTVVFEFSDPAPGAELIGRAPAVLLSRPTTTPQSLFAVGMTVQGRAQILRPPQGVMSFAAPIYLQGRAPSPLQSRGARGRVLHDFSAVLGSPTTEHVMDLVTPGGHVRVPVSSWQATLQVDAASYVQCVIPAATAWMAAIAAATEFVVRRRAVVPGGPTIEYEMARAPAQTIRFDRGPQRQTCTLSGYVQAPAGDPGATPRALRGVRSVSSGAGGVRVRCAPDWLLRPGNVATYDGQQIQVAYINYYHTATDSYCDVGERE